jgi:hypothetical protein
VAWLLLFDEKPTFFDLFSVKNLFGRDKKYHLLALSLEIDPL